MQHLVSILFIVIIVILNFNSGLQTGPKPEVPSKSLIQSLLAALASGGAEIAIQSGPESNARGKAALANALESVILQATGGFTADGVAIESVVGGGSGLNAGAEAGAASKSRAEYGSGFKYGSM